MDAVPRKSGFSEPRDVSSLIGVVNRCRTLRPNDCSLAETAHELQSLIALLSLCRSRLDALSLHAAAADTSQAIERLMTEAQKFEDRRAAGTPFS